MRGLPLSINGPYKSSIYPRRTKLTTKAEYQTFSQSTVSHLQAISTVIMINSVYPSAVIGENGHYNFN